MSDSPTVHRAIHDKTEVNCWRNPTKLGCPTGGKNGSEWGDNDSQPGHEFSNFPHMATVARPNYPNSAGLKYGRDRIRDLAFCSALDQRRTYSYMWQSNLCVSLDIKTDLIDSGHARYHPYQSYWPTSFWLNRNATKSTTWLLRVCGRAVSSPLHAFEHWVWTDS